CSTSGRMFDAAAGPGAHLFQLCRGGSPSGGRDCLGMRVPFVKTKDTRTGPIRMSRRVLSGAGGPLRHEPFAQEKVSTISPEMESKPCARNGPGVPEADIRARETEQQMTDDERFSLITSVIGTVEVLGMPRHRSIPDDMPMSACYAPGVPRLGRLLMCQPQICDRTHPPYGRRHSNQCHRFF